MSVRQIGHTTVVDGDDAVDYEGMRRFLEAHRRRRVPVLDRPAHKGYPHRLNAMGALIAEVFDVPESYLRPAAKAGMVPDLDLLNDLKAQLREFGPEKVIKEWGLDEIDPRLCGLCMGDACEYGCGQYGKTGCHSSVGYGPTGHRVCNRCGGTGREEPS